MAHTLPILPVSWFMRRNMYYDRFLLKAPLCPAPWQMRQESFFIMSPTRDVMCVNWERFLQHLWKWLPFSVAWQSLHLLLFHAEDCCVMRALERDDKSIVVILFFYSFIYSFILRETEAG